MINIIVWLNITFIVLMSGLVILPGRKNDNEQDYLDYLASQHQPNPDMPESFRQMSYN